MQLSARVALRDTEVAGTAVARDEMVVIYLAAANRDPAVFEDPHRFDVERANAGRHLAFSGGRHFCLGAALARAEGEVGLSTFFNRFPQARPAGTGVRRDTRVLRGWSALPVQLGPARARQRGCSSALRRSRSTATSGVGYGRSTLTFGSISSAWSRRASSSSRLAAAALRCSSARCSSRVASASLASASARAARALAAVSVGQAPRGGRRSTIPARLPRGCVRPHRAAGCGGGCGRQAATPTTISTATIATMIQRALVAMSGSFMFGRHASTGPSKSGVPGSAAVKPETAESTSPA